MSVYANASEYMQSIKDFKRITPARELELAAIIHGSDPAAAQAARDELVCANLKLVVKIAHGFKQYALSFDDLIAEGNIGLMRAAEKFEAGHDAKFSVYASWWIKQAMRFAIGTQTNLVKIPVSKGLKLISVKKIEERYIEQNGEPPSDEVLAEAAGITLDALIDLRKCNVSVVSTCDKVQGLDRDVTYESVISDIEDDGTQELLQAERMSILYHYVANLPARKRELVCMEFGLFGVKKEDTLLVSQETGVPFGLVHQEALAVMQGIKELMESAEH